MTAIDEQRSESGGAMLYTLLLRLAGPMQSWGTQSRFSVRDTGLEPSKSGVIGLLCAALGRPRSAPLDDLVSLRMGVRIDRPGLMRMDYQTAGGTHRRDERYGVAKASGGTPETVTSRRYFLADASFLVGLESRDRALLAQLDTALAQPVWPLALGRKACVPGVPVCLPATPPLGPGVRQGRLEDVLAAYPWPAEASGEEGRDETNLSAEARQEQTAGGPQLQLIVDATPDTATGIRYDVPLSFISEQRRFAIRYVRTFLTRPNP